MLQILSNEEVVELNRSNWVFVEPGFIVDISNRSTFQDRFALVKEKNDQDETLTVILLSRKNIFSLLAGVVPVTTIVHRSNFLNVHATEVTQSMCTERKGLPSYCADCGGIVYTWPEFGSQNYRVDQNGQCRHIDCNNQSTQETLTQS